MFKEGFFAVLLNNEGQHKLSLNIYTDSIKIDSGDVFEIKINDKKYPCTVMKKNDIISIQSAFMNNLNLLPDFYKNIEFYKCSKRISVNTITGKIFDFSACLA